MTVTLDFVDQDKLQDREVAGQDDQMVLAEASQRPDEIVTGLGRDRADLCEDNAKEVLVILAEDLDLAKARRVQGWVDIVKLAEND